MEESQPQEVQDQLQSVHEWLADSGRQDSARAAFNAKDGPAVEALRGELRKQADKLENALKAHSVGSEVWRKC